MGGCFITYELFTEKLIEDLSNFMETSGFLWSSIELLHYIATKLTAPDETQIIVRNNGQIVGCNLFLSTSASIGNRVYRIRWSHCTFLEQSFRAEAGLPLFSYSCSVTNVFGFGLTPINRRLHKLIGSHFFPPSHGYHLVISTDSDKQAVSIPNVVIAGDSIFQRVFHANEIRCPNNGYWNIAENRIDFVRDNVFINNRFIDTPINYLLYKRSTSNSKNDEGYFVIRIRDTHKGKSIFLVDYRIENGQNRESFFADIICAIYEIARAICISHCFIFTTETDLIERCGYNLLPYGEDSDIVSNILGIDKYQTCVTPADSDSDLIPF